MILLREFQKMCCANVLFVVCLLFGSFLCTLDYFFLCTDLSHHSYVMCHSYVSFIYEWVTYVMRHMNDAAFTYECRHSYVSFTYEWVTRITYEWVTRITYEWVTRITYEWVTRITYEWVTRITYEWVTYVMRHMNDAAFTYEGRITYEWHHSCVLLCVTCEFIHV